jgi:adenine specific DNA methylase Mod
MEESSKNIVQVYTTNIENQSSNVALSLDNLKLLFKINQSSSWVFDWSPTPKRIYNLGPDCFSTVQ